MLFLRFSILLTAAVAGAPAAAQSSKPDFILDQRLRYEFVDQADLPEEAHAFTLRTRIGWEAPLGAGLSLLAEVENVTALVDDYNDTLNRQARRPVVSDPEATELNRLQLTWSGPRRTALTVGRQRIVFDNGRFVANSGWRQNEQTFDAFRASNTAVAGWTFTYGYIDQVLRSVGRDSAQGRWDSDSHLLNARGETPLGELTLYSYLVDLTTSAPGQSSATTGARLTGDRPAFSGTKAVYALEYARQGDYGSNPRAFGLDYLAADAGLKGATWSLTASVERLEGDGQVGVLTPVGSGHAFHGWSDTIAAAPPDGLLDLNVKGAVSWKGAPIGDGLRFVGGVYGFSDDAGQQAYGRELNASVGTRLNKRLSAELKAARFEGEVPAYADRTKVWVITELKF